MDNDLSKVKNRLLSLAGKSLKPHYKFHAQYERKYGYILQDTVRRYLDDMQRRNLLLKGKRRETPTHKRIMSYRLAA